MTLSLVKWQSTSMRFVLSWKMELQAMRKAG